MEITLRTLYTSWPILEKIAGFDIDAASAIRLMRFLEVARGEHQRIEQLRVRLVQKYGKEIKGDLKVEKDRPEEYEAFWREFNSALAEVVKLPDPKLSSTALEGQRLSAADFFGVVWLFDRQPITNAGLTEPGEDTDNAMA